MLRPETREYLERTQVNDVASHTLGVSVVERDAYGARTTMAAVLPRNTALPFEESRSFYTMRANETSIVVPVLEGEDADPDLCRRIGVVSIDGLPAGRPEQQQVDVTMRLDRDGILEVSATDVATGTAATTTISHVYHADDASSADAVVRSLIVE